MRLLTYSLLLLVLAASIGLSWIFDAVFARYSEQTLSETYRDQIAISSRLAGLLNRHTQPYRWVQEWQVNDTDSSPTPGNYILSLTPQSDFPLPSELEKDFLSGKELLLESENEISINFFLTDHRLVMTLALPRHTPKHSVPALRLALTFLFYGSLLTLLALWTYPLVRRLLKLRETAKAFGEGDLQKRIAVGSVSFIGDIEREFNAMARRIETLVSDIRLLSGSVSHDLRTPLARIRFGVETLAEEKDPKLRADFQERVIQDVDDMVELVEKMLEFSRLEQNLLGINKEKINFADIIEQLCRKKASPTLSWNIHDDAATLCVHGDRTFLSVMINNLLQNATLYGGGKVHLDISLAQDKLILSVDDDGPGIPETEMDQVIKPFVRGKNDSKIKGYGMGLAMVKRIAEWHDGKLEITRSPSLQGASIRILLPVTNVK